jgi:hypothetical protein
LFLFPLWGILLPPAYTLMGVLPFMALGWLCVGAIAAGLLRTRRPAAFKTPGGCPPSRLAASLPTSFLAPSWGHPDTPAIRTMRDARISQLTRCG